MHCISQTFGCLSWTLEALGCCSFQVDEEAARDRLGFESVLWEKTQDDRSEFWNNFQANMRLYDRLSPLVEKGITILESSGIEKGVAVDLGCGIDSTTFHLLNRGWKVYAVDSSESVIKTLEERGKKWIEEGQLVLVNQSIEEFEFPEKVHLVTASDSLPYCNPKKINQVFLDIKGALLPQGVLVCNFFPYENLLVDGALRYMFGAWMTTKCVVERVVESAEFSSWSVKDGRSRGGMANQFHVIARA